MKCAAGCPCCPLHCRLGATAVSSMAFIYPGALLLAAWRGGDGVPAWERGVAGLMVAVGLVQMGFGIVGQFI